MQNNLKTYGMIENFEILQTPEQMIGALMILVCSIIFYIFRNKLK